MATKYAVQQQGVADGSVIPADKADARQVNADKFSILASKPGDEAWNTGDLIYLGKKPAGATIVAVKVTTDTSFGTSTLDIGTADDADKYVDGATNTVTNKPTVIGPLASTLDDEPGAEEELWLTVATANIAAAVLATIEIEMVGIR